MALKSRRNVLKLFFREGRRLLKFDVELNVFLFWEIFSSLFDGIFKIEYFTNN